jgi:PAS domain S-box-containing protein
MSDKFVGTGLATLSALEKIAAESTTIIDQNPPKSTRETILDSIADGVFTVDNNFIITNFNKAAEKITGISKNNALDHRCCEIFKADICDNACALKKTIETGVEIIDQRIYIKNHLKGKIPVSISTAVLKDSEGKIIGGVETFRDLSAVDILRKIANSQNKLKEIICDCIADGVFTVDLNWQITSFNKAAQKITGISQTEAIGQKCCDIFRADICQADCALKKTISTGKEIIDHKVKILTHSGLMVPISISTSILKDEDGTIIGGVETFRDLSSVDTLQNKINEENQTKAIICDSIADGVFTVDNDFNITFFNQAAQHITGVKKEDAIGKKCHEIFHADICETSCALKKTISDNKPILDLNVHIQKKSGERVPITISTGVLRNKKGNIVGGVETFRDLSVVEKLRKEIRGQYTFEDIISKSYEVKKILAILPDISKSDSTVMINGPSGTGKELFARAIHNLSARKHKQFIAVNCGALPDTLLESELFGYIKGAFTDAKKDKPGRFALAQGGTILLDEIGDISTAMQVKLLRVLQEKEFEPLGGTASVKSNVRIIAATNKNLQELVAQGIFRDDLFYRLNVVRIDLPPLVKRRDDIQILVEHFISTFNLRKNKEIRHVSENAMKLLMGYHYPGNIRELENIIEYAFVLCRGKEIQRKHLPIEVQDYNITQPESTQTMAPKPVSPIQAAEKNAIEEILIKHHGSRQKAAEEMGIHKTTLWRKMKKYGIT